MDRKFDLDALLAQRLIIVSGKGGVGKTTVSASLGLLASRLGKKTIIAEINSEEQIAQLLKVPPVGYEERGLAPDLWGINIRPKDSFKEYVLLQIKFERLYRAVFENKIVRRFIEATPGLADLMNIGKVYELTRRYDLVILDAPATGHSIAMFEIPAVVTSAVQIGPLKTEAQKIVDLLHDTKKTTISLVTLPEEMPVAEAIEMKKNLEEKLDLPVGPIFLNQVIQDDFSRKDRKDLEEWRKNHPDQNTLWEHLELQIARAELSREYQGRLEAAVKGHPVVPLPFLYSVDFGLSQVERLATEIERAPAGGA